jgi:hypothetical protein
MAQIIDEIITKFCLEVRSPVVGETPAQVCSACPGCFDFKILVDGEDVTSRCVFASEITNCAVLLTERQGGGFMTSLDVSDPSDLNAQLEGLVPQFRRGKVEILKNGS